MKRSIISLALIGMAAMPGQAVAQPRSRPAPIGTCAVVQTTATTVETDVSLRATGSCRIAEGPDTRSCTAEIVPAAPDLILDMSDTGMPQCRALAGDDPCSLVQNGLLEFQSQRHATQTFSTDGEPVAMTIMVRQKKVVQTFTDLPPSAAFPLNPGRLFDVVRNHTAVAARLQCAMADGDSRIFPIVGEADPSPNIRFVAKNSAEPTFDILTYRVVP
jgi:hypothetical protein